ncbi:hypothetical protein BASA81_007329 [Batrachochytrium salamandrivorans]|nr:hypothetical protein BASA81_007329 [Batrachochytrium salamandrivorans]
MFRPGVGGRFPVGGGGRSGGGPVVAMMNIQPSKADPPPPIRPHADLSLSFDFEPEMEVKLEKEKQKQLRTADPRFKTVVCVHWVSGLCMKGEKCEFLHEMDMDRMPECRLGQRCQEKMCPFKHVKDEERALCNNYNLGFCQHGAACRYQHKKRGGDQLPVVCEFAQVTAQPLMAGRFNGQAAGALPAAQRRVNYRTALCQTFSQSGTCNYGENCDFAHSVEEMQHNLSLRMRNAPQPPLGYQQQAVRPALQSATTATTAAAAVPQVKRYPAMDLDRIVIGLRDWTNNTGYEEEDEDKEIDRMYRDPMSFPTPRGGVSLPDASLGSEPPNVRYFLFRSQDFQPLAASLKFDKWMAHASFASTVNQALQDCRSVFFFFAVNDQECFAGVARMTSRFADSPAKKQSVVCGVQWLRICELRFKKTAYLTAVDPKVQRELPVAMGIEGQELPPSIGHVLMKMLYTESETQIDKAGLMQDNSLALDVHPLGPAPKVSQAFTTSPLAPSEVGIGLNVAPHAVEVKQPGFVFSLSSLELFEDCMKQQRMGVSEGEADSLKMGTIFFVYTPFDGKLHGVFEAISGLERSWDVRCLLPMQFKFRSLISCHSIADSLIPQFRQHRKLGLYAKDELQGLVNLFATKAKRTDAAPPLKSPCIEAFERGVAPAVDVRKGLTIAPVTQLGPNLFKQSGLINYGFDAKFRAPNRLIGKSGVNMRQIQEKSGATKARVLAGEEAPHEGVMEMIFEANTKESVMAAFKLGEELLQDVVKQWEEFQRAENPARGGGPPPPRGQAPRGMAPPPQQQQQQQQQQQPPPQQPGQLAPKGGNAPKPLAQRGTPTPGPVPVQSRGPINTSPPPASTAPALPPSGNDRRANRSPERGRRDGGGGSRRRSPSRRGDGGGSRGGSSRRRDRSRDSDRRRRR